MPPPTTVAVSGSSRQGARSNLTPQQIMDQAYKLALQKGLGEDGARVLLAILQTEGGLTGLRGDLDIGGSAGPLQFYVKGQLPNYASARKLSMDQAMVKAETDPLDAIGWALDTYLGGAIRAGQQQGLQGPQLATYAQAKGQVSKTPERAGQNYSAMFSGQAAATQPAGGSRMAEPTTTTTSSSTATAEESAYLKRLRAQLTAAKTKVETARALRSNLPPLTVDDSETEQANKRRAQAAADEELKAAMSEQRDVQNKIDQYEYQAEAEQRKADAGSKPQTPEDAARARLYDAQATKAERENDPNRTMLADVSDALKSYEDLLNLQITQGNLNDRDADKAWAKALALGAAGVSAEQKRHDLMRQMAPQMGDRQLAQAAVTQLQGWRQHGAKVPDFELPVFTMDPAADYAKWLPDPGNVQELWQRALAQGPERKRQDEDMLSALEARANAVIAEQGGQGWDGAMATGGSAAPLADPMMGGQDYGPDPAMAPARRNWVEQTAGREQPRTNWVEQTSGREQAGMGAPPTALAGWDMRTGWPTPPQIGPKLPPRAAAPTADEELMEVERVLDENPSLSLDEAQNEARMRLQSRR